MGLLFRRRPLARLAVGAAAAGAAVTGAGRRAGSPTSYVAPHPVSTGDEIDELSRLVQMYDNGALSDDDFTAAKAQLLGL